MEGGRWTPNSENFATVLENVFPVNNMLFPFLSFFLKHPKVVNAKKGILFTRACPHQQQLMLHDPKGGISGYNIKKKTMGRALRNLILLPLPAR